jgi:hypothetical protein
MGELSLWIVGRLTYVSNVCARNATPLGSVK